jgi:hypothetical protein
MDDQPRIPPGSRRRIGPLNAAIVWAVGRASGGRPPNVFTTLLWPRLTAELDDGLLIELCLLIGHYEMLAMTLNTLRVQLDPRAKRIG